MLDRHNYFSTTKEYLLVNLRYVFQMAPIGIQLRWSLFFSFKTIKQLKKSI